ANTVAFTALVILSNELVLNFRSFERPMHKIGWLSNMWLIGAISSMILLQLACIYTPPMQKVLSTIALGWGECVIIIAAAVPMILGSEIYKAIIILGRN